MYDFIPLHIIVEEFCPLFFTEFLQFIEIYWHSYMHSSLKVPPEHFNQVEVCALARHGSDSFLFQSFCCRFVTVLEIMSYCMTQSQLRFACYSQDKTSAFTEVLTCADDPLIKHIWQAPSPIATYPLNKGKLTILHDRINPAALQITFTLCSIRISTLNVKKGSLLLLWHAYI